MTVTPSPQSVVVPVELLAPVAAMWREASCHDLAPADDKHAWGFNRADLYWGDIRKLAEAAAPAPSSLAGGDAHNVVSLEVRMAMQDEMMASDANGGCVSQRIARANRAAEAILAALSPEAPAREGAWACMTCNSPRAVDPCQKCGTALTKPADGWDWPRLPDIERIRELAREVGYAVGVHGTLERDLDLIAVPWVVEAVTPFELAQHIASGLDGNVLDYKTQDKPCGRWSCNINLDGWFKLIDLSVMPPALTPRHEAPASEGGAVAFRDVFLSWHEECGTVERAGYGASPIGKFQNRWPGFHKKLWDAAMKSHDALRDAWVKVAKECEK